MALAATRTRRLRDDLLDLMVISPRE